MPRLTITVTDEQSELLSELSGNDGRYESKSEAVRSFIESGEDVEQLRQEVDRLNRERRQLIEQRNENQELVEFASETRSVLKRREDRSEQIRTAPVWRRALWWFLGEPK
jgi:Arc/MetJ-type ribon-helix-helix transcriptional regulator